MGIRTFFGFRALSKRGAPYRKGNKGPFRHRRMTIEQCENRLLLANSPVLTSVNPMTGPTSGGTQVTIVGTNLAGATSVNFGNPAAAIVSDTATQIVATSPAEAAGAVDITVTTPNGTSALSAIDKFTYVAAAPTGPQLAGIIPNTGSVLTAGEVLNVAPTQLTLQFNQNEQIDPTTLSGITISYTNAAGVTANAPIGYLAVNDAPDLNQVIVRFSQTLLSGNYTVNINGAGANALQGELVDPATGQAGPDLPFNSGQNYALSFTLDLGSMVNAVVPQPVTRTASGGLQQSVNEIDVYFTDKLSSVSAQNPQFYQLIATDNTANTSNQTVQTPTSVVYNAATNEASLYFFQSGPYYADPNNLSATARSVDLNRLAPNGTQALRLRIGDSYQQINTTTLSPAAGAAGTTYADAYPVLPSPSATSSFGTTAQSYVISNEIETTAYDLQWPGSDTDPGNRKMVYDPSTINSSQLVIEGGFINGVGGSVGDIPTYTYNFPATYGIAPNPTVRNQITPAQEQDTREIFSLISAYLGVQFEQSASTALYGASIGVATGDLSAVGYTSGTGIAVVGGGGLAVVDGATNWGTSPYGGPWMQAAMQGIMLDLGFGRSYNLPPFQVMGDDPTLGSTDTVLPGVGNLTTGLNLYPAVGGDINMYKITLTTPGTLSAETIAERLSSPSMLDTELRVFQQNADGSYSAVAQNDDFFSDDSYVSLSLPAGTYFVGVSASGNDAYDPSIPNSGMNGKTTGPYQLRVNFTPQETLGPAQASGSGNIVLTGSNITVNTGTTPFAQAVGSGQVTIKQIDQFDVPSVAALNGETFSVTQGIASYSFQFVDTSIANNRAAAGNIAIDFNSTTDTIGTVRATMVTAINDVFTVLVNATGTPFDGDADGTPGGLYNYWFNVAGTELSGTSDRTIFVDKSASSGGTGAITAPYSTISAALAAAATDAQLGLHDIVRIEGNHTSNDNPANLATIADNQSYNIGTDIFGKALSDGSTMVVPRDTTVMIDAGAVLKLRGANIQVGSSSVNVNLSGAALQVLGTPLDLVYFTSWQDSSIGKTSNPITTAPKAGDWGGIVFENDLDIAYDSTTPPPAVFRPDPEANGIFLDYLNGADLFYGGGVVSSNSVPTTYDPIYMVDARPTVSYNVIEHSADAAMSADPNSFQESLFEGNSSTTGLYTADYDRVGPALNANLLLANSINGMLVRIRTAAGEPIDTLTTSAQFVARDITYVIPQNLEIAGTPGGPVVATGNSSQLLSAGSQQIQAVPGASLVDGSTFTITKSGSSTGMVFEFDGVSLSVLSGSSFTAGDLLTIADPANLGSNETFEFETVGQAVTVPSYTKITFDPGDTPDQIEAAVADAINTAGNIELTGSNITVNKGTTPFAQVAGSGGATIQQIDATSVPNVGVLNGETFTVKQGSTSYTFQFVDTSNAANHAAAGNTAIDYNSTTDTIDSIRAAMVAAINGAFNGALTATDLAAITLPYVGGEKTTTVPATVALESFTATQTITFKAAGTTTGLTVVGAPGVAKGHQRIVFDASQSADEVALEVQAAIVASGLYPASMVTVEGTLVTINDPTASFGGLVQSTESPSGSLVIDPGVVVKLAGSRIEAEMGATFIAEGTANDPIVFTSVEDDRYGSGGTFDVTGDGYDTTAGNTPQPGDWSGILADPVSQVSIDHAVIAFAGGFSSIEGGFADFNAIETRQAQLRVANSLIEDNADGAAAGTDPDRAGRGYNGPATIYVLGAQPAIVDNTFLNNDLDRGGANSDGAAVISIDVNSLNSDLINDWGRATGPLDAFSQYNGNFGPLVRGNVLQNNGLNGMLVRSGVLSTQSVWDDTGIVYIVEGDISVPNLHTYGGLRLQSSSDASLVVKLLGADAGFTASGDPLDITDRIGGEVQIVGQPGYPVILTSLNDNTVGAGFDLSGNPQDDTVNNPKSVAAAGDWRSVLIEQYSNDTNVEVVSGLDAATGSTADTHSTPATAQYLGQLAASANAGDDTLRLGFEVHGAINYDDPSSVDVYSFTGTAGTDVYIAMDLTSFSLDSVVELVDANGNVIARSDNKVQEDPALGGDTIYLGGSALPFQEGDNALPLDTYSDNADDPALRVVLPGPTGQKGTYYLRVSSALNIGHIDATDVPDVAALDGTTFQVADSNALAIGDIDTSHVLPGIGIGAAGVTNVASLNLEAFTLTVGVKTVTFQFVDTSNAANKAAAGNTPIDFNSTTDSIDAVCNDIAQAITAAGLGLTATKLADDSIGITGATFAFAPGTTPFQQQVLTGLNGTTFQVTDAAGKTVTFEFVDSSSSTVATAGNKVISYNSTIDTIDSIRNDMIVAISSAGLACTALAQVDGTIALTGLDLVLDLGQTPFLAIGSTNQGATFEFIDTNGVTQLAAGDQPIYYNSKTDTIDDIRNDMVLAINGYTAITGVDATHVPKLASLDGETFEIADNAGKLVTFEFIDTQGTIVPAADDVEIVYDSATDTIADVRADMAAAINAAGLEVTAAAQPWGVALSGTNIAFSTGTTPFGSAVFAGANCGVTAQARPDDTIGLYGYKITFGAGSTPFVQYGRSSGSFQLQVRLQADMDIPGSEVQYADISYATNGVDIQGMPSSSPLVTSLNSVGTNTTFATSQNIGNLLDTSNSSISVSGYLSGATDVNWYSFQLSYKDIMNLSTVSSFPLILNVSDADGLTRPDTMIWVFDSTGTLLYEGVASSAVDHEYYLSNGATNPNGTSYGPNDPFLGPIDLTESSTATYYVAVTSAGMTADALQQSLTRQAPISPITRVVTSGSQIGLTPEPYTLADVTLYTNTTTNLDTVNPMTGATELDVTGGANLDLPQAPAVTYGDIAMRPDGELYGFTDSTSSETAAGQYVRIDTGNAANAISTTFDGIQSYTLDANGTTLDEQTGVGFNINAMAYGPLVGNNWPLFVVGNRAATYTNITGVTPAAAPVLTTNLLYKLNPDGTAIPYPGQTATTPQLGSNIIPLAALNTKTGSGGGGNITGMAYLNNQMYCVDDTGDLFALNGLDLGQLGSNGGDYAFAPATSNGVNYITTATGGPTLKYIGTFKGAGAKAIMFEGLTDGPADVGTVGQSGGYANTLFAVDGSGNLYAINPATIKLQPIFVDGLTTVPTGLGNVQGLAFSNVDYNLWHTTNAGTDPAGSGTTFYFGIENPGTASGQPAAAGNYQYQNAGVFGTYNAPGGAEGSLESTQTFSLAGYTSQDAPVLSFDYYVDATNGAGSVLISNDGANWTVLDTLSGPNNGAGWKQAVINLSAFVGDTNLRLRFDFTTAANPSQEQSLIGGGYLTAVPGDQLRDGDQNDYLQVAGVDKDPGGSFEFDLGAVLDVSAAAGAAIANGQTFTINDGKNPAVTFELDNGSNPNLNLGTNTPVYIRSNDSPSQIVSEIAATIQAAGLNVTVYSDTTSERVEIVSNATPSTLSFTLGTATSGNAITLEGDGPGAGGHATVGTTPIAVDKNTIIPVNFSLSAAAVAQEMVAVMDATLNVVTPAGTGDSVILDSTQTNIVQMIGHAVVENGTMVVQGTVQSALPYAAPSSQAQNISAGQRNTGAGLYIDNLLVGFDARGVMFTGATADTNFNAGTVPKNAITSGSYVLQIQRAPTTTVNTSQTFNINDRMTTAYTLQAVAGTAITSGDTFSVYDGITTKTFEFVLKGLTATAGDIPIYYTGVETAPQIASLVNAAINATAASTGSDIYSTATSPGDRVNLFNAQLVAAPNGGINILYFQPAGSFTYAIPGDVNQTQAIGETIIASNQITNSLDWGILVEPGTRDAGSNAPHPGSVNPLTVDNNPLGTANNPLGQVGGVTLENNVINTFGAGGIELLGDPDPAGEPTAAVPFFRVVNNTIYGGTPPILGFFVPPPAGIAVGQNSAPTLLNNIIANVQDAVTVDATSTATVLGDTVYQDITDPAINTGIGLGIFPLTLSLTDPLFEDPSAGNFYLAAGSQAIGSGLNSLPDRAGMVVVETSLGLPPSPIIAPALDELGQTREDAAPPGQGSNVFMDRGAVARVDITPPIAQLGLVEPPTGSFGGVAPQWVADDSTVPAGQTLSAFAIQLLDTGTGIDNTTVLAGDITVYRSDNAATPLVQGTDYFYNYDAMNHIIYLAAGPGVWTGGFTYTIDVNNSAATGIADLAGNVLSPNQPDGTTSFTVTLVTNANFSHAPGYPVAWHFITDNLYLGHLSPLPQPYFVPSLARATDDGVDFSTITLVAGQTAVLPITVTNTTGKQAYLNAWIDFAEAGTFTADDQVIDALAVNPGVNNVTITVPASAAAGTTWARFRLSTTAALGPSAGASDGEVEDYGNVVIDPAPVPVSGTVYNDIYKSGTLQANDPPLSGWTVFLDTNGNGKFDPGEPSAVTDANGAYAMSVSFVDVPQGAYNLLEVPPPGVVGFTPTQPVGGAYRLDIIAGANYAGEDFGNYYTAPPVVTSIVPETPPDATPTGASVVHFVVTFNNPVTGVTAADFSPEVLSGAISGATISSVSPGSSAPSSTFVVTVSGITGNGALVIELVGQPSTIEDASLRPLTGPGSSANNPFLSQAFTIDQTAPRVAVILATDPNPGNASAVHYTVVFSKNVVGVGVSDFSLISSAGLSGASITSIVPDSATLSAVYVVTVNSGTGSGMLGLDVANGAATIADLAGNPLSGNGSSGTLYVGPAYEINRVSPTVASIVATDVSPTKASVVHFTVNFSTIVVGVGVNDFSLVPGVGLSGTSIASIVPDSGTPSASYVVTVNTGAGAGSLGLNLANGGSTIADLAGNSLSGNGSGSTVYAGPAYAIDHIPPTVASIVATDTNPTNASVLHFTVNFSKIVVGVGVNDFTLVPGLGLSGVAIASIVPNSTTPSATYVVTVNTGAGSDTLGLDVANGASTIVDHVGNPLSGNGSGSTVYAGPIYTIDRVPPTVTSIVTTDASLTNASAVHFTVNFSKLVVGVGVSDFTLVPGPGLSGVAIASIVPNSTTLSASYVVTVNTGAGSGSLGLDVANGASTIADHVGNPLSGNGSGSTVYAGPAYTIDRVPPKVASIVATDANPTNASLVHFTVNFSKIVVGVGVSDFALVSGTGLSGTAIASVVPNSATPSASYVVTVNTGAGSDTLGLNVANGASTIVDLAGNYLSGNGSGSTVYAGPTYTIDHIPPTVASIVAPDANPTNASVVHYTVNFTKTVVGVGVNDFSLVSGAGLSGTAIASIVPSSTTPSASYVVTVDTGAGSDTLGLDVVNGASTIADHVGNPLSGNGSGSTAYAGPVYTIDRVSPTVASIIATDASLTNASVVHYTVNFSKTVVGVGINDFSLVPGAGLSGTSITSVVPNSTTPSASYVVTVNTGAGSDTLGLDVANGASTIADHVGNPLFGNGSGSIVYAGPAYTIDRVAPTVTIALAAGQNNPTYLSPINFSVVFSKPVSGLTAAGIDLSLSSLTNLQVQSITGSGTTYDVAVSAGLGVGTVVARVSAGAVQDAAGNVNSQSGTATVNFNSDIDVTVVQPSTATNPSAATNSGPIMFTVTFSQPVLAFTSAQLSFTGSTAPGNLTGTVMGSGPVYTVAVSGMTGTGRVQLSVAANTVYNAAGEGNTASTGTANYIFYDITPPTETLVNPAVGAKVPDTTINAQQFLEVAYSVQGGVGVNTPTITDAAPEFTLSGAAASGVVVNGAAIPLGGDLFEYPFTGSFSDGTVTVNFIAGSFQDNAGNYNTAASYSFTVVSGVSGSTMLLAQPATVSTNAVFVVSPTAAGSARATVRQDAANIKSGTGAAVAALFSPAAMSIGPKLPSRMVAAIAAMQASSTSNQKRATTAVDAVFATLMSTDGS